MLVADGPCLSNVPCYAAFTRDDVPHGHGFKAVTFHYGCGERLSVDDVVRVLTVKKTHEPDGVSVLADPHGPVGEQDDRDANLVLDPLNGVVKVPTRPGMGIEIDESKIDSEREFTVD